MLAIRCQDKPAFGVGFEPRYVSVTQDRRVERSRPQFKEPDQLGPGHVAVRLCARVCDSREAYGPVRSDQAEGIPAPRSPGLCDAPGVKNDVVDLGLSQVPASGKTGLAGADDGDINSAFHFPHN